jgi:anti-sigma factor RsiW
MSGRRIKDALLERYLAGALPPESRAQLEAVLAESEADRARLRELEADSAAFLLKHPPGPLVAKHEATRRRGWRWPALLFPVVAALAAALLLMLRPPGPIDDPYTIKGDIALKVLRESGTVESGAEVAPGTRIRFSVTAGRAGYVAVLSRDAAGAVTVYHPYAGTEAAPYEPKAPVLPDAIELDDVKGEEAVYALFSEKPFRLDWAVEALRARKPLKEVAPPGVAVAGTSFVKR